MWCPHQREPAAAYEARPATEAYVALPRLSAGRQMDVSRDGHHVGSAHYGYPEDRRGTPAAARSRRTESVRLRVVLAAGSRLSLLHSETDAIATIVYGGSTSVRIRS